MACDPFAKKQQEGCGRKVMIQKEERIGRP
jgi:hypothetical protein